MKILFLTDIHDRIQKVKDMVPDFYAQKPDLIIIGGDFQCHYSFDAEIIQRDNQQFIDDIVNLLSPIAPVQYILGNHDCVFVHKSPKYITKPFELAAKLWVVCQSGSSSSLRTTAQPSQLVGDDNIWVGYPFGPVISGDDRVNTFCEFQNKKLSVNNSSCELTNNGYNDDQIISLDGVPADAQLFVLTHQGPFLSPTSYLVGNDFSAGSPQNQLFYDANKSRIAIWLHGHSHEPINKRFNQIIDPGTFKEGLWCVVDISCDEGLWDIKMVEFK